MLDGLRKQLIQVLIGNDATQDDLLGLLPINGTDNNGAGGVNLSGVGSNPGSTPGATDVSVASPIFQQATPETLPTQEIIPLSQIQELQKQLQRQNDIIRQMQANNIQNQSIPAPAQESFDDIMLKEFITPMLEKNHNKGGS